MEEIFHGRFFALYAQVGFYDAATKDSYPEWQTGEEHYICGPKGIAVATIPDTYIEVFVYKGKEKPTGTFYGKCRITIGNKGVIIGNEVAADFVILPLSPGLLDVWIYVQEIQDGAVAIYFVICPLSRDFRK